MTQRSAPDGGYDFGNKRQYRRTVWRQIVNFCKGQVNDKHVLLMPSSESDEIELALDLGFRQEHLHIVDDNAAIVATHKRMRYPRIHTYGVDTNHVAQRIMDKGIHLTAAHFDWCGPYLTECQYARMMFSAWPAAFTDRNLICTNGERGRDDTMLLAQFRNIADQLYKNSKARGIPLATRTLTLEDEARYQGVAEAITTWWDVDLLRKYYETPCFEYNFNRQHSRWYPFGMRGYTYKSKHVTMLAVFIERHYGHCSCPKCQVDDLSDVPINHKESVEAAMNAVSRRGRPVPSEDRSVLARFAF